jgi:hypothetical protein
MSDWPEKDKYWHKQRNIKQKEEFEKKYYKGGDGIYRLKPKKKDDNFQRKPNKHK